MEDLNDLMFFAKIVEHGGFSEAGRRLGVPKSRLSRRMAVLEERMGVRLLQRSPRRITLTGAGQSVYERCRTLVELAESTHELARQASATPQGEVRISCPITLAQVWLTPLLPCFMQAYPLVRLHVAATNRRVDPIEERMDVVIRVRRPPLPDSDQVVRKLGASTDVLVASARLFDTVAVPQEPEDIAHLPTLSWPGRGERVSWSLASAERALELQHVPRLVTDDMFALREAARAGMGIALLPRRICQADIRAGRLVQVLPRWASPRADVLAVFTSRRGMLPAVRALLDYLDQNREDDTDA